MEKNNFFRLDSLRNVINLSLRDSEKRIEECTMIRLTTGVRGLDQITKGGFFKGYTYALIGAPGTGKTILSLQWLHENKKRGEKAFFSALLNLRI